MRILTHNFMQCPRTRTYPLQLVPTELETVEAEYNGEFLQRILPRLNWDVLRSTAQELSLGELPETMPSSEAENQEEFQVLHTILMETHVKTGKLVSEDGKNVHEIENYIPNMMTAAAAATADETKMET